MRIIGCDGKIAIFKYTVFSLVFVCSAALLSFYAGSFSTGKTEKVPTAVELSGEKETNPSPEAETKEETKEEGTEDTVQNGRLLMIDPGHGGEDGGAVSDSGILEKDLNLVFSDDLAHLCLMFGVPYKMTREDDSLLYGKYGELEDYTGKKKSYDLKNRLKYSRDSGATLLVSVHMNKFSDQGVKGLQVYHSTLSENEKALAASIHAFVSKHLQRDNNRVAKAANSSIYLLNKSEIPAILIEFGFLSNPAECSLLTNYSYSASLTGTVFVPILEYFVRS